MKEKKMKTALIALMTLGFSTAAMADGFVCYTQDAVYGVKVFNQTDPNAGTRNGAIMIVSDNRVDYGRKTIATFEAGKTLFDDDGARYIANVDLRYSNSNRAGENFLGTKLGQIDTMILDMDFNYGVPMAHGEGVAGRLIVLKRNGAKIEAKLACSRYLKN